MIAAIVLSAGESSRMGRPKALLPVAGVVFADRIVSALRASKARPILLVLGHQADEMREKLGHLPVTFVINRDYEQGQLSSLHAAIRQLETENTAQAVDGILVHLVDHPFITSALVDLLIDGFYDSKKLIVVPRYRGRRGHPVIFSRALFGELLRTPLSQGAKAVVRAHGRETLEIDTEIEGVTVDIDTPEEYRRYVKGD